MVEKLTVKILKTASSLPKKKVDNFYFEKILDTSDEWIRTRTGIRERRFISEENLFDLIKLGLDKLNLQKNEKDRLKYIIFTSCSTSYSVANIASQISQYLGLDQAYALDINMACSGYVAALEILEKFISEGEYGLIVSGEYLSRLLNFKDRSSAILFGDGVGLSLLGYEKAKKSFFHSSGFGKKEYLSYDEDKGLQMEGRQIYRFASSFLVEEAKDFLERIEFLPEKIDWLVCHQANKRILASISKKLKISKDKIPSNLESYGNTSSASIPILLDELNKEEKLKRGDKILLLSFGAGLAWSIGLIEW